MKKFFLLASCAALASCGETATDNAAPTENIVVDEAAVEEAAANSVMGTSWSFTEDGTAYVETIDADGNYISETADGKHADHGTAVMKDGKACFTSAMSDEGERCFTVPDHAVGDTITVVEDNGEELEVTRTEYVELSMPGA